MTATRSLTNLSCKRANEQIAYLINMSTQMFATSGAREMVVTLQKIHLDHDGNEQPKWIEMDSTRPAEFVVSNDDQEAWQLFEHKPLVIQNILGGTLEIDYAHHQIRLSSPLEPKKLKQAFQKEPLSTSKKVYPCIIN
jgi:hypothetical protein